ncbi:MAG TPA: phytanoyl-CoA dioxygenase family protein, partial [Chitinophagaceae bacterium]|nr:phytanoyl-CoA dioxygenase family protein [Chitinophagaceae bacterium]
MKLTSKQVEYYHENGYLILENLFTPGEVNLMLREMNSIIHEDCPRRILEKNGAVRSFFAPDMSNSLFSRVTRLKKLVEPSLQLLGDDVYIHQTKINSKHAMLGDWWEWHQDYTYWKYDDGMPRPDVLTAMIYL